VITDDRLQKYLDQLTWCETRQEEYELLRKLIAESEPLIRKYEREKVADWLEEELHDYSLSPKGQRSLLRTLREKE